MPPDPVTPGPEEPAAWAADGRARRTFRIVGAVVGAMLIGVGAGHALAPTDEAGTVVVTSTEVSAGPIRAEVPGDWTTRPADRADAGPFALRDAVEGRPAGGGQDQAVVVGMSAATGPGLLPAALAGAAPDPDVVVAGPGAAYRYQDLSVAGRPTTVVVLPTTAGVVTVLCPVAGGDAVCAGVVESLRLEGPGS